MDTRIPIYPYISYANDIHSFSFWDLCSTQFLVQKQCGGGMGFSPSTAYSTISSNHRNLLISWLRVVTVTTALLLLNRVEGEGGWQFELQSPKRCRRCVMP